MELIAKTLQGLEPVLKEEIRKLGVSDCTPLKRAVRFQGNLTTMYRANYELRTALRILCTISHFHAAGHKELYDQIKQISWEDYLDLNGTLYIDSVVQSDVFNHSRYVSQVVKDAIADRFLHKHGKRPSVERDHPDLRIHIHINRNQVSVALDSSGGSLHKRGYRKMEFAAPLNEVLAAGIVMLSGWNRKMHLLDPMCGSGTIITEAALLARNIAPGSFGRTFGFERWKDFQPDLYESVKLQAKNRPFEEPPIRGSDISPRAVAAARRNIRQTGLKGTVEVQTKDFLESQAMHESGMIIMNPPYGRRMAEPGIEHFYKSVGDKLKNDYTGYTAWIFSANSEAMKSFGLHPFKRVALYNGPLKSYLYGYQLYRGSLKSKYRSF